MHHPRQIREIRVRDLLLYVPLPLLLLTADLLLCLYSVRHLPLPIPAYGYVILALLLAYLPLRSLAIGLVLLYKAFAPRALRGRCRFEPTCSTYMIMAIQKYGLIRGIYRGIRRILRCTPPNGGVDLP